LSLQRSIGVKGRQSKGSFYPSSAVETLCSKREEVKEYGEGRLMPLGHRKTGGGKSWRGEDEGTKNLNDPLIRKGGTPDKLARKKKVGFTRKKRIQSLSRFSVAEQKKKKKEKVFDAFEEKAERAKKGP